MENNYKKNMLWNFLGVSFNSFNSLFFLIIINRINGIEDGGIFSFGFSVACLLFVIGIYAGRTYQVSDVRKVLNDYEYFIHKIITCFLMILVSVVFIVIQNYTIEKNIVILSLTIYKCLEAFSDTLYGYMQKKGQLYLAGISQFIKSLISIVVFLLVDLITKNLILSCFTLIITNLLVILLFDMRKTNKLVEKEKVRYPYFMVLFKLGFSIFAFSFLAIFIVNVPKYVLDVYLNDAYQTIFNIIVMPATVISLCGQYIMGPSLTGIVTYFNDRKYKEFGMEVSKIVKIILVLGILIELAAYLLGIPVLSIVYAIDLSPYRIDLVVIIFGAILYALANIYSTALITMRKNNLQLLIYTLSSIIGILLSIYFIRLYGIHGATYAYFGTMIVHGIQYILYYNYEFRKLREDNE